MSGYFVAPNTATPRSEYLLGTLSSAKSTGRYVAIGGDPTSLLLETLDETEARWEIERQDLSGVRVQVHSETSAKDRALKTLQRMGVSGEFYVLPARP